MRWLRSPSGQQLPSPGGPPHVSFSLFQFDDVIDNIMRLDNVLGYMNPEMQMPNTVPPGWGVAQRTHRGCIM